MKFKRLSSRERDEIARLRGESKTWRDIGALLGRSHTSLSREWQRNRHKPAWGPRVYLPHTAQKKARQRQEQSHRRLRLKSMEVRLEVLKRLELRWSPELIAGRLKRVRPDLPGVSHEAIYQWIYSQRRDLIGFLARAHRKRFSRHSALHRRLRIPGRQSIHLRPLHVQQRLEGGHWETDLMIMKGGCLQVSVERKSRYTLLAKVPDRTAGTCRAQLTKTLGVLPKELRRSITYDNGSENFEHLTLNEDLGLQSYFCEPYHSWEKGTVENTNGLLRWWFPRGMDIRHCSDAYVQWVQQWVNYRPRKIFKFQNPREIFDALGAIEH